MNKNLLIECFSLNINLKQRVCEGGSEDVFKRMWRHALEFAGGNIAGLLGIALFVAASRAIQGVAFRDVFMRGMPGANFPLDQSPELLNALASFLDIVAGAWMAVLVVRWLRNNLGGEPLGSKAELGVAVGAGLPLYVVNIFLAWAVFLLANSGYFGWPLDLYILLYLALLAVLLPPIVYSLVRADGFWEALNEVIAGFSRQRLAEVFRRPGFWAAFAALALWLLIIHYYPGTRLVIERAGFGAAQYYRFLLGRGAFGLVTTLIGVPLTAAVLRAIYEEAWGRPAKASATPAPADA